MVEWRFGGGKRQRECFSGGQVEAWIIGRLVCCSKEETKREEPSCFILKMSTSVLILAGWVSPRCQCA